MAGERILLVDDEQTIRFAIRDFLELKGFVVDEAANGRAAVRAYQAARPDVAIVDYRLEDGDGIELLRRLIALDGGVPIIILTAHGSIDLAVRAIKEGAEHFLTKPIELPALLVLLQRICENQIRRKRQVADSAKRGRDTVDPFLGESPAIRRLAEQAQRVLGSERPILIEGETGVGKGVLAHWLHDHGPRAPHPFIDLNTAGLAREFFESELFGYEKGAFTSAHSSKPGMLEIAHRGTVFLDEIGDVDLLVQPKLLKVVEEHRFRRMGEVHDRQVDVQLISASHQNLQQLVDEKRFRSDLYFRISTIPLQVPALRERRQDIRVLAEDLLRRFARELGRDEVALAADAVEALEAHDWPGNVRELRNVLERAVLLSRELVLHRGDLGLEPTRARGAANGELTLAEVERRHIEKILAEEGGRVDDAARRLGIPRSTLYKRLKEQRRRPAR
jgi:DNA-binding NtrC family response regulator